VEEREEPWEGTENREGRVMGVESGGVERRESGWRGGGKGSEVIGTELHYRSESSECT